MELYSFCMWLCIEKKNDLAISVLKFLLKDLVLFENWIGCDIRNINNSLD